IPNALRRTLSGNGMQRVTNVGHVRFGPDARKQACHLTERYVPSFAEVVLSQPGCEGFDVDFFNSPKLDVTTKDNFRIDRLSLKIKLFFLKSKDKVIVMMAQLSNSVFVEFKERVTSEDEIDDHQRC